MSYIVLDLEWNMPGPYTDLVETPFPFTSEIVEFGAVRLDDRFQPVDEYRGMVRPCFYPEMNGRIARLTQIHDRDLAEALPFPEAYRAFAEWCGVHDGFLTWGPDDMTVLMDNLLIHGMTLDCFPVSYDLQRIYGREIMREDRQFSLESAMQTLKLPQDRAHDALNDARATASIACNYLDLEEYLGEYLTSYVNYAADRFLTKTYRYGDDITADPEMAQFTCPYCGETASCANWIFQSAFFASAACPEGDEFFVTVLRKKKNDHYSARRVIREMSVDLLDIFERKLDRQPA